MSHRQTLSLEKLKMRQCGSLPVNSLRRNRRSVSSNQNVEDITDQPQRNHPFQRPRLGGEYREIRLSIEPWFALANIVRGEPGLRSLL